MQHRGRLACGGKAVIKLYIKIPDENESYCCAPENYICGMKYFSFMPENGYLCKKENRIAEEYPENSYKKAEYTVIFLSGLAVFFRHDPSPKKSLYSIN